MVIQLNHTELQLLFRKAERKEIPAQITLGMYDFYHWGVQKTNKLYLVFREDENIKGITFDTGDYRDRRVLILCDLCQHFIRMWDSVYIRSVSKKHHKGIAYKSMYSFICQDTETCHNRIKSQQHFTRLLAIHIEAIEPVILKVKVASTESENSS